jgi:O-antigen/teichoic acid export membrane protein
MRRTLESSVPAVAPAPPSGQQDVLVAVRNALKLGLSLLLTWGVSIAVRFLLPRYLGPDTMAPLTFAEAFAAAGYIALSLGVDMYIYREVPVRPAHASDFFGSVTLLRLVLFLGVGLALDAGLWLSGQPEAVRLLVAVFGASQLFTTLGNSLAAMLHASTRVDGLSVVNVVTKAVWGAGVLLALVLGAHLAWVPAALLVSEALRAAGLWRLCQRHVGLTWRVSRSVLGPVLLAGLPFFISHFASNFYQRLAVTTLNYQASPREVAWYGQAVQLAFIIMLAAPIVHWVLMPMLARAAHRATEELAQRIRRAVELVMAVVIPVALGLFVGAELWVELVYGREYAPAAASLRLLAPTLALTYVNTMTSMALIQLRRHWRVVANTVTAVGVNFALNLLLIGPMGRWLGDGGAGAGAALALTLTELCVAVSLGLTLGSTMFDRRSVAALLKTLGACAAVVLVDRVLPLAPLARVAAGGVLYAALVLGSGAVRPRELLEVARAAMRKDAPEPAA